MLLLKSRGATLLWHNEALKINNCEINSGLKKLTIGKMITPPVKFRGAKVDHRSNGNTFRKLTLCEKEWSREN